MASEDRTEEAAVIVTRFGGVFKVGRTEDRVYAGGYEMTLTEGRVLAAAVTAACEGAEGWRKAHGKPPALTIASIDPGSAEQFGEDLDELAQEAPAPDQRMAITPEGDLKPVAEFTAEERWWCDGEECDGYPVADAPHVHVAGFETRRVDLLTGKDERHPEYGKRDDDGQ